MLTINSRTSQRDLADELGRVNEQIKELQGHLKALKEEVTRRNLNSLNGREFVVTRTISCAQVLNTSAIRKDMGKDWIEGYSVPRTSVKFGIMARS